MPETHTTTPLLTDRFLRAMALAQEVHGTQLRKGSAIPYMTHLMSVAALVLEHGGSEDAAIGGLLHDAVEDSDDGAAMERRIRGEFGDAVADIVMGCSDAIAVPGQAKAPWRARKEEYLQHLRAETNRDVLLVSACDKLHNARSVVADLRAIGPAVWTRFSVGAPDQLWYYQQLAASYEAVPAALRGELQRVVRDMSTLSVADRGRGGVN